MWKVKDEYAEHEITIRDQVVEIKVTAKNLTELELYNLSIRGMDLYYMFEEVKEPKTVAYEGVEPDKAEKKKPKGKK